VRFRSEELLKNVSFFFDEMYVNETRFAHAIEQVLSSRTDVSIHLKKKLPF